MQTKTRNNIAPSDTEETVVLRIAAKTQWADDVVGITLEDSAGAELPPWTPGAHVDVHLPGQNGELLVRQYSLCSDPADSSHYQLGILLEKESRGGSSYIHQRLQVGEHITVSHPRNNFTLLPAKNYIFIAGGIGITPIVPMLREVNHRGAQWSLHYGGRTKNSMALVEACREHGENVYVVPEDELGFIDLPGLLATADDDTLIYCCGPGPLIQAVETASSHWPPTALHVERFVNDQDLHTDTDHAFEVELELTGKTITVEPHTTILEAVRNAGVNVPSSCQEGTCGTCETFVLDGEIDHRDAVLSQEEKDEQEVMMICVSRCRGKKLTLEL